MHGVQTYLSDEDYEMCIRDRSAVSYSLVSTLDDDRVESDRISSYHYRCENNLLL